MLLANNAEEVTLPSNPCTRVKVFRCGVYPTAGSISLSWRLPGLLYGRGFDFSSSGGPGANAGAGAANYFLTYSVTFLFCCVFFSFLSFLLLLSGFYIYFHLYILFVPPPPPPDHFAIFLAILFPFVIFSALPLLLFCT